MNQTFTLRSFNPLVLISRGCFQRRTRGRKIPVRKPIYYPMAPSKLYVIKEAPYFAEDEKEQYDVLKENYLTGLRTLRTFLYKEVYLPTTTAGGFSAEEVSKEAEEQERLLAENDAENERQRIRREEKTAWIREQLENDALIDATNRIAAEEEDRFLASKQIEKDIERSSTFITKDTLEKFVLQALDCPTSYEFAVDLQGKIIFSDKLHPYALKPSSVPETSDLELEKFATKDKDIKLQEKTLYK
ncbi:uncharacterized protein LOC128396180 [Panonychus citri]|uniref:uncharacterized protein LOC128396180 n=1 Tax=Panonychus citri TaxID=50023 RepID=UPI0023074199|nr:uncharacterized protein LOC128396180 [Panonychus citri]